MFKKIVLMISLFIAPYTYSMAPGTVIDPMNYSGQCTISLLPEMNPANNSLITISHISKAGIDIGKTKGIPVLLSFAASAAPWWALTIGSGYLLITSCDITNPLAIQALVAGASYALAGKATQSMMHLIKNSAVYYGTHASLIAACLGVCYFSGNSFIDTACITAAQSFGVETLSGISAYVQDKAMPKKSTQEQSVLVTQNTGLEIGKELLVCTGQSLEGLAYTTLCDMIQSCDSTPILCVLLYEQAYRLAQNGCKEAQQLFTPDKSFSLF